VETSAILTENAREDKVLFETNIERNRNYSAFRHHDCDESGFY
jgi:hypothetical protein